VYGVTRFLHGSFFIVYVRDLNRRGDEGLGYRSDSPATFAAVQFGEEGEELRGGYFLVVAFIGFVCQLI
jgi:hypothetical protein